MPRKLNRALVREEIAKVLLFESAAIELDADIDSAAGVIDSVLSDIVFDLETIADQQEDERIDEAGVALVAGAALAMPVIMKGIGKVAAVLQSIVKRPESDPGEDWDSWWSKKADDLHHLYIGICKKIVDAAVNVAVAASGGRYKDPGEEAKKQAANVIFLSVIAIMAVSAGFGLTSALQGKAYAVAGTESILGSIKLAEIQALSGELLLEILGMSGHSIASAATTVGAFASGIGPT